MYGIYENGQIIAKFVTPMSVFSNTPVFSSDSLSLKRQVVKREAQRWEITSRLEPLKNTANDLFMLFVENGTHTAISIIVPQNYGSRLSRTPSVGILTVVGNAGDTEVAVTSSVVGDRFVIPRGTFCKIGSDPKLYALTLTRSESGTMSIFPALRSDHAGSTLYWEDDVEIKFLVDSSNVSGMTYIDGVLMDVGEVKLVEDV